MVMNNQTTLETSSQRTVFIAEDCEDLRMFAEMVLAKYGFNVQAFEDGKLTLEALVEAQVKPHLLLTDINMPNMNGHELIKAIRNSHPELDDMKIVIYSTEDECHDGETDTVLNTVSLHKPAKADTLIEMISKLILAH